MRASAQLMRRFRRVHSGRAAADDDEIVVHSNLINSCQLAVVSYQLLLGNRSEQAIEDLPDFCGSIQQASRFIFSQIVQINGHHN